MKLEELFKKVQERELSREKLEEYRDNLVGLFGQMCFELAEIKKRKAIFFIEQKEKTDIATERKWQGTKDGLREIELRYWAKATEKLISSLKDRTYRLL